MLGHLRQLASESLVYGLANVAMRSLAVVLVPVYTRLFDPAEYGVLSLVTATIAGVSIVAGLALDTAAHRWYWDTASPDDRRQTLASWAWCQLTVASALAVVLVAGARPLARLVVGDPAAAPYLGLAALTLPLSGLGVVAVNWLRMQRRPWATALFTLASGSTQLLLTLALAVGLGWRLAGVFAAQLGAALASAALALALMRDWLSLRRFAAARLRAMLRYALPLIPAALAYWVVSLADRYFLRVFASTAEVGLYAVGSTVAAAVALATGAFQQAWGPFALSIHQEPGARRVYAQVFLLYLWGGCALATALTLLAPEILALVATEAYAGSAQVVGFLSLAAVMTGLSYVAAVGPTIVKTMAPTGLAISVAAVADLGLCLTLVPAFGSRGAAAATLVAQALVPAYVFYRSQRLYPIPYRLPTGVALVALAVASMAAAGPLAAARPLVAVGAKLALLALWLPLLPLLGVLPKELWQRNRGPTGE